MSLLIKHAFLNESYVDILINKGIFSKIDKEIKDNADTVLDANGMAVLPAFYNLHTHTPMTLLKGLSDDKDLFEWLSKDIWPREALMTNDDVYYGTRLAGLEMIKSGTAGFADMYFGQEPMMNAVNDMGLRAAISFVQMDFFDEKQTLQKIQGTKDFCALKNPNPRLIQKSIAVHAVYSASETLMDLAQKTAQENDWLIHIHVAETKKEVDECFEKYGCSPLTVLDRHGLIGPTSLLAHCVHLTDEDIQIASEKKAVLTTNPASNMKLNSGLFPFAKCTKAGCRIALGTDGSASNNTLSIIDTMRLGALASKIQADDPTAGSADEIFTAGTKTGAEALRLNAGVIEEGKCADCILIDMKTPLMTPHHNLISNMVYATDSSCVNTLIVDGKVLMKDRCVPDENFILDKAEECAFRLKKG